MKTTGVVKFTLDPSRPPKLTPIEKRRLAGLRDAQIDFSGIPETSGVNWKRPGLLVPEQNKHQITLRIDADVLAFFRTTGRRYQTRMNEVLRTYMAQQSQAVTSPKRRSSR